MYVTARLGLMGQVMVTNLPLNPTHFSEDILHTLYITLVPDVKKHATDKTVYQRVTQGYSKITDSILSM